MPGAARASLELFLAGNTAPCRRLGVQARPADRVTAIAAGAIAPVGDPGERRFDLAELGDVAGDHRDVEVREDVRQYPIFGSRKLVLEADDARVVAVGELALYLGAQRL